MPIRYIQLLILGLFIAVASSVSTDAMGERAEKGENTEGGRNPGSRLKRVPGSPLLFYNDKPWFPIGDSISQGWMELGTDFDQDAYLELLSKKGINTLMIWAYIGITDQGADKRVAYDAPRIWPWLELSGNLKPPYNFQFADSEGKPVFNEAYFRRLRDLIKNAEQKGIVIHISIHDGWTKTRFDGHPFNKKNGGHLAARAEYVAFESYQKEVLSEIIPSIDQPIKRNQWIQEAFTGRFAELAEEFPNVLLEILNEGEWYPASRSRSYTLHLLRLLKKRTKAPIVVYEHAIRGGNDAAALISEADAISYHGPWWSKETRIPVLQDIYRKHLLAHDNLPVMMNEPVPEYQGTNPDALFSFMWGIILGGSGFWAPNDTAWKYSRGEATDPVFEYLGAANAIVSNFLEGFDPARESLSAESNTPESTKNCLRRAEIGRALCFMSGNLQSHYFSVENITGEKETVNKAKLHLNAIWNPRTAEKYVAGDLESDAQGRFRVSSVAAVSKEDNQEFIVDIAVTRQ